MKIMAFLLITSLFWGVTAQADDSVMQNNIARAEVKELAANLKAVLRQAVKDGGLVHAMAVCNAKAPGIAARLSLEKGWHVGRTSLKVRNNANSYDAWEKVVMEEFESRNAAGEDPSTMEYSAIIEKDGHRQFRYMKAIPTAGVCLACHGEHISKPIQKELQKLYPQDKATGFKKGDIRGAFIVSHRM